MIKYVLIIQLYALSFIMCAAQTIYYPNPEDSSIIKINEFYKGYGKVFEGHDDANKDAFGRRYSSFIESYEKDFELSHETIIKAEQLLFEHYNQVYSNDERFSGYDFTVNNPQRHLRYYYRQYMGFINNKGENIILIHLMNFRNKKRANHYFNFWDQNFNIGSGDFYGKNQKTFLINLSKHKVTVY
jgi:hypothetical protein